MGSLNKRANIHTIFHDDRCIVAPRLGVSSLDLAVLVESGLFRMWQPYRACISIIASFAALILGGWG
jgi:hypothetical protein